jgi:hypothetical protein
MLEVELRNFFYLLSMNLSESHDSGHQFHMLPGLTRVIFLAIFFIDLFSISSFNIELLGIKFCNFFYLLSKRLFGSHDPNYGFDKLT